MKLLDILGLELDPTSLTQQQLLRVDESIDAFLFKQQQDGEPFEADYKTNPKTFDLFVKKTVRFENALKRYFASQVKRLPSLIKFYLIKADDADSYLQGNWDNEQQTLSATIEINLENLFNVGTAATELAHRVDTGIDATHTPSAQWLREYSLKLAGEVTQTTKDRIKQQLLTGMQNGETRDQITARIEDVVNNPVRAKMIAQTEAIRAYAQGRLAVGKEIGVGFKRWNATLATDSVCGDVDGEVVGIENNFSNDLDAPPAHPNCRCSVSLLYEDPSSGDTSGDSAVDNQE